MKPNLLAENKMKTAFSYKTAEYHCTKCSTTYLRHGSTLSIPYLIASFLATIAFSFKLFRAPWNLPWYYFFGIFAGEILLFFVAGFLVTVIMVIVEPKFCGKCKAPLQLAGRHFTYSKTPRWSDYVLFILFVVINIVIWLKFESLFH
jgi:hypothetical protein